MAIVNRPIIMILRVLLFVSVTAAVQAQPSESIYADEQTTGDQRNPWNCIDDETTIISYRTAGAP